MALTVSLAFFVLAIVFATVMQPAYASHLPAPTITSSSVTDDTFTATWIGIPEVTANPDKYQIQVADNPSFTSHTSFEVLPPSTTFSESFADGTYYFRVRAFDQQGAPGDKQGPFSTAVSFVISTVPADTTPPAIAPVISGTLGNNGWYVSDVQVSWDVTDEESEIAEAEGCDAVVIDYDTDGVELTCEAASDGGTSSESVTIMRDATAPTISVTQNAVYAIREHATSDAECSDDASGIDTCEVPEISVSSVGPKSYSVTATDAAGNSATETVDYSVKHGLTFFSPANYTIFKKGSTIPIKFKLFDAEGDPVKTAVATITVDGSPATSSDSSNTGNHFKYVKASQKYLFNLNTKPLSSGIHTIVVTLDDGTSYSVKIALKVR